MRIREAGTRFRAARFHATISPPRKFLSGFHLSCRYPFRFSSTRYEFGLEHDNHIQNALGKRVNGFWGIEALVAPPIL